MKKIIPIVLLACAALAGATHAAGLDSGTAAVNTFKTWLYTFLGAVAFIYLMFKGGQAWAEKIQWFDFLVAIGKVAAVGGVLALTAWAWAIFA